MQTQQAVVRVDDVLLEELRRGWTMGTFPTSVVIEHLRRRFNIEQREGWEQLLLYGRTGDAEEGIAEEVIGLLIAITPGIVILDTSLNPFLTSLSGLIERGKFLDMRLFGLRSFFTHSRTPGFLDFLASPSPQICPVWMFYQIADSYSPMPYQLGIDPARWEVLESWLNKWLPKE